METEKYWTQQEAILLTALALFPDRFEGQLLTLGNYSLYFASQNDDEFVLELNHYKKAGYFNFTEVPVLTQSGEPIRGFLVSDVNIGKAGLDIKNYIDRRQRERSAVRASNKKTSTVKRLVNVVMEEVSPNNYSIFVELDTGERHLLKKSLRKGLAPYSLMRHLITNRDKSITLSYANSRIEGCEDTHNLGEIIRQCGFSKELKNVFFTTCKASTVQLKKEVYLSNEEVYSLFK